MFHNGIMKGVYISSNNVNNIGIERKISAQIGALKNNGLECSRIANKANIKLSLWQKIAIRLPFFPMVNEILNQYSREIDNVDFVYIRQYMMSWRRILAIRKIRRRNPRTKILYEIPTYPFKKELTKRWIDYPLWWREWFYGRFLKHYIDRVIVVGDYDIIDGIKTIPMINGVDMSLSAPIIPAPEDGAIHIMALANIEWWHGYDRFLKGMARYYRSGGQRDIVLHVVGTGRAHNGLVVMVRMLELESRVILHGYKFGDELDAIYNQCHIGLISLATQDKDVYVHSTLKSRDYLAKGLPTMATGMTDVFIGVDYKYNLELPADANAVNLQDVIDFYDGIYGNATREQVIAEVRAFAERTVDINVTMAPVVNYLKGCD